MRLGSSAADFRFTSLDDEVENYGWSATLPVEFKSSYVEFSGGWAHARKAREYWQAQFSLGYLDVADPSVLEGSLDEVFSDANILADAADPDLTNPVAGARVYSNNILFDRQGTNSNSYLAATMTDSIWAKVDWTIRDTWRVAVGARWEDYRQLAVDWTPSGFSRGFDQWVEVPDVGRSGRLAPFKRTPLSQQALLRPLTSGNVSTPSRAAFIRSD